MEQNRESPEMDLYTHIWKLKMFHTSKGKNGLVNKWCLDNYLYGTIFGSFVENMKKPTNDFQN